MLLGIDHLVIAVPDPDAAAAELERTVGLAATSGGRHEMWGTYNRLAWLGDTYVELIGLFDAGLAATGTVSRLVAEVLGERRSGLVSYALATDDVRAETERLRAAGSSIGDVETRSRTRPDGEIVTWHAADGELGPELPPFLIEHELVGSEWGVDARAARAGFGHPVGASVRLAGLELPARDVSAASARYAETVGIRFDPTSATGHVGEQWIRLVPGRPLKDPAVVELAVEEPAATARRDIDACGVRWRLAR